MSRPERDYGSAAVADLEGVIVVEPLRLGVVGLGVMGAGHLEKERGLEEVRFVGVADVKPEVCARVSAQYDLPAYPSAEALIDSGRCEAVLVATPHPFHCPVAEYAASRGLHVLSEKPIAVTVGEADRMIDACRRAGVLLGVMFQQRTMPLYRKAKELLEGGVIGRVYRASLVASAWYRTQAYYDSGDWRGTWKGEGGGVIMNQAPHSLDLFVWLGGRPVEITASVETRWHRIEVEDTISALLKYGEGKSGYFYTTTSEWPGQNRFEFAGERGKLVVDDDRIRLYRMAKSLPEEIFSGPMWGKCAGAWEDVPYEPAPHGHAEVVKQFARAVRLGEPLVATGEDGRNALELANAMLLSGFRQKPVPVPVDRAEYDAFLAEKRGG